MLAISYKGRSVGELNCNTIPDPKEVCDLITKARDRFQTSGHLDAAKRLDCNFLEY
jgi:hypothetical protein